MTIDLSAVVVNFQSAALCAGLVDTLLADRFEIGGRAANVEVIVVDNASRGDDVRVLERLVSDRVTLIRNTENVGYALANNQGFRVARGRLHLVINPDCRVPRGALGPLVRALETLPDVGAVGPLASLDEGGRVLLPPNELPDPYREHLIGLARRSPRLAAAHARRRARAAHAYWTAKEPVACEMLSGGCFLGRRETFARHGLFDGGYPLYFEDTDLFRRLRSRSLRLWHVPSSRIVHFFSRSAITRMKAAMARNEIGARRYYATWFGAAGLRAYLATRARAAALARDAECPWPLRALPPTAEPPTLDVPEGDGVFLEIAGNPQFTLAAGMFPSGPGPYAPPADFFSQLGPGSYWLRAVDPSTGDALRAWSLIKA